ncbi:MBL fold metallo-hydrolase [Pararoseomonas indoligenes]|uniref:MBL fold metallo-hydrolase n=1 Tax=Roseomonas indoligenes TaxID=2820811 RepID=A0A940MQZ2_9PROT|nr:MBL fold metallo-hydrolase [Pararoseomonas indoligenes]MBP0492408.1 MBL fold metallo-hydrolase [Pararoseomonas indoligenes]
MNPVFRRDDPLVPGEVEWIAPGIRRVICNNPGPFTFRGTNTYLIGRGEVAVLDPGPVDAAHLDALLAATAGERVTRVLVSHTHRDHSPGTAPLKAVTGAETLGFGPHLTPPSEGEGGDHDFSPDTRLADGAVVEGEGWRLTALHTPGHCANHLCFALEADAALAPSGVLFSADHVMAWSTSIVSPPDGDMADYMRSLDRVAARGDSLLLPGHGPAQDDPGTYIAALIAHRREREAAVLSALRAAPGPVSATELVRTVYGSSLEERLVPAAARSLLAHLLKLAREGAAREEEGQFRAVA